MSDLKKRKKSHYYKNIAKKSKQQYSLVPGLKGFLCTCNQRERDCIREAYNLLNEYADKLYGEETLPDAATGTQKVQNKKIVFKDSDSEDDSKGEDDIQSALAREVCALKEVRNVAPSERRFQVVESGASNCLFIRTTVDDPVALVETVLKDIELSQQQKTRFLLRLIPIEITCKAWPDDVKQASQKLFEKYFKDDPKTYCVVFNRRNNSNIPREDLINMIAGEIKNLNPLHRADMKHPELAVIAEVICGIVCLSVVPKYFHYRKYNLIELSKTTPSQPVIKKNIDLLEPVSSNKESNFPEDTDNPESTSSEKLEIDIKAGSHEEADLSQDSLGINVESVNVIKSVFINKVSDQTD